MKKLRVVVLAICCLVFALALTGCQDSVSANKETEPFYVFVLGNDSRTGTIEETSSDAPSDDACHSDTMMLVRVDPTTYDITIVSIPRDTAITYEGQTTKFNDAYYEGGIDAALEQVKELTGVEPKYYLNASFVQFDALVDALSGLEVNVSVTTTLKDIITGEEVTLSPGEQNLDGGEALVLARFRKGYDGDQDAVRQIQDRKLVRAGITKVLEDPENISSYVDSLLANVNSNWGSESLSATATDFAEHVDEVTISSGTGPYAGGSLDEATQLWLIPRDEATWATLIETVDAGGDPNTVVAEPTEVKLAA